MIITPHVLYDDLKVLLGPDCENAIYEVQGAFRMNVQQSLRKIDNLEEIIEVTIPMIVRNLRRRLRARVL